jgi:hypothetical protein
MPQSVFSGSSSAFVNHLLELDSVMISRMGEDGKSSNEEYQTYLERLSLYEKVCLLPLNETEKLLLQANKDDIYVELKLFILKQDIKKQLDETQSVLYDLKKSF